MHESPVVIEINYTLRPIMIFIWNFDIFVPLNSCIAFRKPLPGSAFLNCHNLMVSSSVLTIENIEMHWQLLQSEAHLLDKHAYTDMVLMVPRVGRLWITRRNAASTNQDMKRCYCDCCSYCHYESCECAFLCMYVLCWLSLWSAYQFSLQLVVIFAPSWAFKWFFGYINVCVCVPWQICWKQQRAMCWQHYGCWKPWQFQWNFKNFNIHCQYWREFKWCQWRGKGKWYICGCMKVFWNLVDNIHHGTSDALS